ncbi:hypothetical protein [Amycolatopsis plumensis]|uniref:hypothetical protein n=1 Tax=Amycolatopsis plumensis TaxID=236508 RepID=UPI003616C82F
MGADTRLEEPASSGLAERHRRDTSAGRSTFRAWLYRIATTPAWPAGPLPPGAGDRRGGAPAAALPGPAARRAAGGGAEEPEASPSRGKRSSWPTWSRSGTWRRGRGQVFPHPGASPLQRAVHRVDRVPER